ncbi:MAG: SAM-dependent methyltransferase [Acidobacteriota bacterium]|nr:SAM-dependent methyltransferase [Acidobacteriota bacterium]
MPLQTAGFTCLCRACAAKGIAHGIGVDHLAHLFLPKITRGFINVPFLRRLVWNRVGPPGSADFVTARTIVIDQAFMEAVDDRLPQIALLGAGYDTRAFRFKTGATKIYELDLAKTQLRKRRLMEHAGIEVPENLKFTSIDFTRDPLKEKLEEIGFDCDRPALFIWEGVTPYLPPEAIESSLKSIASCAAPGSRLVFDYMHTDVLEGRARGFGAREMMKRLSHSDSPVTFHFSLEPEAAEPFIERHGFRVLKHFGEAELNEVLRLASVTMGDRVSVWMNILLAEVPETKTTD